MKSFVVVAFLLCTIPALAGEQSIVPTQTQDGGVSIKVINSDEIVHIGPEKDGKRAVVVFLESKRYEGTVVVVKEVKRP